MMKTKMTKAEHLTLIKVVQHTTALLGRAVAVPHCLWLVAKPSKRAIQAPLSERNLGTPISEKTEAFLALATPAKPTKSGTSGG
jgi:hypothetical protein